MCPLEVYPPPGWPGCTLVYPHQTSLANTQPNIEVEIACCTLRVSGHGDLGIGLLVLGWVNDLNTPVIHARN